MVEDGTPSPARDVSPPAGRIAIRSGSVQFMSDSWEVKLLDAAGTVRVQSSPLTPW
jgi:hypothetical protein